MHSAVDTAGGTLSNKSLSTSVTTSYDDDDSSLDETAPLLPNDQLNGIKFNATSLPSTEEEEQEIELKNRKRLYRVLPAITIGCLLAAADQTIIVSSHSKISSELGALNKSSWLATGYLLTFSSFQVLYGKLSDIFGRRNIFLFAYATFGLGNLLCGLSKNMAQLIAARAVVGLGGGGFTTLSVIVISDLVPLRRRGTWQALRNMIFSLGLGAGSMGGTITDKLGWRWSFLIQVPIIIVGFLNLLVLYSDDAETEEGWRQKLERVDFLGAALVILAVVTLLLGFDQGSEQSWTSPLTLMSLCISGLSFACFAYVEGWVAAEPFVPKQVIWSRTLGVCLLSNFLVFGWWLSVLFNLPLAWESEEFISGSQTALRLLPAIISGVVASIAAGLIIEITCRYYWLIVIGHFGSMISILSIMLCGGWVTLSVPGQVIGLTAASFFVNICSTGTLIALQSHARKQDQATAIASLQLFRSLGSEVALAGCAAIIQRTLRSELWQNLEGIPDVGDVIQGVIESLGSVRFLNPAIQDIVQTSYEVAISWGFMLCFGFAIVSFMLSLLVQERSLAAPK